MTLRTLLSSTLVAVALAAGCVAPPGDADHPASIDAALGAHAFEVGMSGGANQIGAYTAFRAASGTPASDPRLCHAYTYWDVARHDPPGASGTHTLAGLLAWMDKVTGACDEMLVTFQGPQGGASVDPPSVSAFEQAFVAFQRLTDAGQPLAGWAGKLSYTAWNEPNNRAGSGNGLGKDLSPELAAQYYLALRARCAPSSGCKVAAGDFATDGGTADGIAWNCADDDDPANTETRCAAPSSENPGDEAPSYLDRYKGYIANHAAKFGLPSGFRPEIFAYHPWHDVNGYIDSRTACSGYGDCVTRRLLQSLGGSWAGAEIWDTEIGVGLQNATPPDAETTQPCGAAFLVDLTDLSPRITRLYYMFMAGGNGPLLDGSTLRPAGRVLAQRATTYVGAKCADTGIALAPTTYQNPVIPMFDAPAGAESTPPGVATEGCPDPTGIKTRSGEYYIYCTSYTYQYSRYDGFPIFKSDHLAGDRWTRVGSIIADAGPSRSSWPRWIKDEEGRRYGNFWAPDVHELPSGKFVATYSAPCGDTQCIGMAWADSAAGPWTHKMDAPFVSPKNNGARLGTSAHKTYDPNLLVASDGELYLYWVVAGSGVWGARVKAAASGELSFAGSPVKLASWGQSGPEGPYVIERRGAFYLFYSDDPTGGIVYNYQVHVRRAAGPLDAFDGEDHLVLHKSDDANGGPVSGTSFVATGGSSVIQDAVSGVDFMVYHAIRVPDQKACPAVDPTDGKAVAKDPTTNPYCRVQSERQAMIDPITWTADANGVEWPTVNDGTPSTGPQPIDPGASP